MFVTHFFLVVSDYQLFTSFSISGDRTVGNDNKISNKNMFCHLDLDLVIIFLFYF